MSDDHDPRKARDLQEEQDPDEAETRHDEEEGPSITPMGRTEHEQDRERRSERGNGSERGD